jgi:hypothetical protein
MTMTRTVVDKGRRAKEKNMQDMKNGEVCFVISKDRYVIRIGRNDDAIFFILGYNDTCNWYDYKNAEYSDVRELLDGEKVTVEFTK